MVGCFFERQTMPYSAGIINRVKAVDVIKPPITTVAKGRWTSAPILVATAIGKNPKLATRAVIKTGRRRSMAPCRTASRVGSPSVSSLWIWLTNTTPFKTAIPKRATQPTTAEILNGNPRIQRDRIPPDKARGTFKNMSKAGRIVPKITERMATMRSNVIGTTTASRREASSRCLNCRPIQDSTPAEASRAPG